MKPHSEDNGIEYLTALVRAQFDPDAAEPPLPGTKTNQKSNKPRTIPELRQQMAQRLAEKIRKEFQPGLVSLFVLTERQAATLEALELPPELTEEVLSLNWLREEMDNYAVNDRLEIITTMPPSDEGKKPDWNKWWMDHAGSGIGVHRPQDHDPLKDPLSEMLNQVISAMAQAAAPEIPNHGDMARHMLEFGVPEAFSKRRTRPKNDKLDLTQVWIMGGKIRSLAWGIGITGQEHPARRPDSPEELLAELEEQGTQVRQDMGTITGLEELRKTLREANIEHTYANARSGQWHDRKARESHLLDHRGYGNNSRNQICIPEGEEAGEEPEEIRTQAEWNLMTLTVPEHPGAKDAPLNSPDEEASNIGFLNRLSPKDVREYLEGRSEEPNPPMPEPCPRAAECPSWCGRLQETGEFPFPLTHDGRHESCQYWQFMERHRDLRPAQRKIFAQAAIDAELDRGRRNRDPNSPARPRPGQNRQGMKPKKRNQRCGRSPRKRSSQPCSEEWGKAIPVWRQRARPITQKFHIRR